MVAPNTVNDDVDGTAVESVGEVEVGSSIVQEYDVGAKGLHKLPVGGTAIV